MHFLQERSTLPRCKQRKGREKARPLERVNACGDDAKDVRNFAAGNQFSFCKDCLYALRIAELRGEAMPASIVLKKKER